MSLLLTLIALVSTQPESPIFCNLKALSSLERAQYAEISEQLARSVVKAEDVPGGYRLHLAPRISTEQLFQWIQFERRCCPFLDVEMRLDREDGARWVQLTGREGVKEFLLSEFKLKRER